MKKTNKLLNKTRNKITKKGKHITALLLAGVLLMGDFATAFASEIPSEKEEIVYTMADANGNVTGVYVVNVFSGGDIVDYGNYTDVRNMTTTDKISVDGDKISLHSDAEKVYYQGNLDTKDIPWNIKIFYYIDGKEYAPDEIAGMSGKLEIKISIEQNDKCDESFWEGYALQATILLDAEKCSNIVAEDATIANVASDKQLSYIILPGKGKEISITADVEDFEMKEININGVKLNLNMEMDDGELQDKVKEIQDAISELNDGAIELNDGAGSLDDGAKKLNDGIKTIQEALYTLDEQSYTLTSGSAQVLDALKTIQSSLSEVDINTDNLTKLAKGSSQIQEGIDSLVAGLETMDGSVDQYYQALNDAGLDSVDTLVMQNEQMIEGLGITSIQRTLYQTFVESEGAYAVIVKMQELVGAGDEEAITLATRYQEAETISTGSGAGIIQEYIETAGKLITVEKLLAADCAYINGSNQLISGISAALDSENGQLMTGAATLQSKYQEFDTSIQNLVASLETLAKNMKTLKKGIDELVDNYTLLDEGINKYTGAVAQILNGYNTLYEGSIELTQGTSDLYKGTKELLNGTDTFKEETSDMDTQINDTIDETVDTMTGKNVETVSFVSEKNTNVNSVLFVIKTQAIEKEEVTEVEQKEEKLSLWQKFLNIFDRGDKKE